MKKNNKLVSILLASSLLLPGIAPLATGVTSVSAATETVATAKQVDAQYVTVVDQVLRNVRSDQAVSNGFVPAGKTVTNVRDAGKGWFQVDYDGNTGYIQRSEVTSVENYENMGQGDIHNVPAPKDSKRDAKYIVAVTTGLRTKDVDVYRPLRMLKSGEEVEYLGTTAKGWFKVKDQNGVEGYVNAGDVTSVENYNDTSTPELHKVNTTNEPKREGKHELLLTSSIRTKDNRAYRVIAELQRGDVVTYHGTTDNDWFKVKTEDGKIGFIYRGDVTAVVEEPEVPEEDLAVESVSAINTQGQDVDVNAMPINATLQFQATGKLDKDTVNVNTVRIFKVDGNVPIALNTADVSLSENGEVISLSPSNSLAKNTEYKVVLKGLKGAKGEEVAEDTFTVKTGQDAIITKVFGSAVTNDMSVNLADGTYANGDKLKLNFDDLLAPETVTTSNITITDVETGKRVPLELDASTDKEIEITLKQGLVKGKQYKLSVKNLKTATGFDAEAYELVFNVGAIKPTVANAPKTLDKPAFTAGSLVRNVWGNVTGGLNEAKGDYHPGLQFTMTFATKLDESTIDSNIVLVEKESEEEVATNLVYNDDAKMVTLTPESDLKEDTQYEIQVKKGLKSDNNVALGSTDAKNYPFETQDLTAPTVAKVSSKNGDQGLKLSEDQEFTIEFSEKLEGIVNYTSKDNTDTGAIDNQVAIVKVGADLSALKAGDVVTASLSKVADTDATYKVTVDKSDETLEVNSAYQLIIFGEDSDHGTPVEDAGENKLKNTFVYNFTTEGADVTAPKVVSVHKGSSVKEKDAIETLTNVKANQEFTFKFDEVVEVTGSPFTLEKQAANGRWGEVDSGTTLDSVDTVKNTDGENVGVKVKLNALNGADEDAKLRLVINNTEDHNIKDEAGNIIAEKQYFEFITTSGNDEVTSVQSSNKDGGAADATFNVKDSILVTFGKDPKSVKDENIVVTDKEGNVVEGSVKAVAGTKDKFVFTPAKDLSAGTVYTVTVDGVTDKFGNKIAKKVFQFTTPAADVELVESSVKDGDQAVDKLKTITFSLNKAQEMKVANTVTHDGTDFELEDGFDSAVDNAIALVKDTAKTTKVNGLALDSSNNKDFKVNFDVLADNADYTLVIKVDGEITEINFTTGVVATDDVAPALSELNQGSAAITKDSNGIYQITATDAINLVFDEDIATSGMKVSMVQVGDATNTPETFVNAVDAKLTINPVVNLKTGTYKLTVSGVKDTAGNVAEDLTVYVQTP